MAVFPSYLAQHVRADNFCPILSRKLTTSGTSSSVTFTPLTGTQTTTVQITNKGTFGAYMAAGVGSATAIPSLGTGNGAASCFYVAAGAIFTYDFVNTGAGPINTFAAIEGADTQDAGSTILELSIGFGQ